MKSGQFKHGKENGPQKDYRYVYRFCCVFFCLFGPNEPFYNLCVINLRFSIQNYHFVIVIIFDFTSYF